MILEDVLSDHEVAELNGLIGGQNLPEPGLTASEARFGASGSLFDEGRRDAGFLDWGAPFCALLDHQAIMDPLRFMLGDGFRIDHYYGIYMREGTEGLRLHGGNTPYDPPEYYHFRGGHMYSGLTGGSGRSAFMRLCLCWLSRRQHWFTCRPGRWMICGGW